MSDVHQMTLEDMYRRLQRLAQLAQAQQEVHAAARNERPAPQGITTNQQLAARSQTLWEEAAEIGQRLEKSMKMLGAAPPESQQFGQQYISYGQQLMAQCQALPGAAPPSPVRPR